VTPKIFMMALEIFFSCITISKCTSTDKWQGTGISLLHLYLYFLPSFLPYWFPIRFTCPS
jgi:hypothetical protein